MIDIRIFSDGQLGRLCKLIESRYRQLAGVVEIYKQAGLYDEAAIGEKKMNSMLNLSLKYTNEFDKRISK